MFPNGDDTLRPLAPLIVSSASSVNSVTLEFLPALTFGRPPANSFTANCSGNTSTASGSPITVSGLQSGTAYSCSVTATNQFGNSSPSDSVSVNTQIQTYTVTPSAGAGGSISPNTPRQVAQGNTTSFTVTPNSGFNVDTVTGCSGSLVGTIYTTGAITTNCSVAASFKEQPTSEFTVTASAGSGGSITPNGAQVITVGETTSFIVTPTLTTELPVSQAVAVPLAVTPTPQRRSRLIARCRRCSPRRLGGYRGFPRQYSSTACRPAKALLVQP